jgi:phage terminase small subunit
MAKGDRPGGLTPKQRAFVREYLKDSNGTQAAKRAGYAANSAAETASKLLRNPKVRAMLDQRTNEAEAIAVVDKAWVLTKLRENVERAMQERAVTDREGEETGEFKYDGAVANKALELLGKDLGMFVQKVELSGSEKVNAGLAKLHEVMAKRQARKG